MPVLAVSAPLTLHDFLLWEERQPERYELVGGDTTQGPLNVCITVFGEVVPGQALLRSGARAGDEVFVSGTVGDARLFAMLNNFMRLSRLPNK